MAIAELTEEERKEDANRKHSQTSIEILKGRLADPFLPEDCIAPLQSAITTLEENLNG